MTYRTRILGLYWAIAIIVCGFMLFRIVPTNHPHLSILIYQDKPEDWADALQIGFQQVMNDDPIGKNVTIVPKTAAGDAEGATNLSQAISREHYSLIYSLGTQATQEVFQNAGNTPILFGAITDPVAAGLYRGNLSNPLGNITGTQDLWPYAAQFDLMAELVPHMRNVGIIYNSSEVNSQVSVGIIRSECARRGITLLERTVTEPADINLAVSSLISRKIDALYIPADNTAQGNAQVIIAAGLRAKIPVFTGIPGIVQNGALGTVGTNYIELGKVNARQALQILKGTSARNIPVATADTGDLYLNETSARQLGIVIPSSLRSRALEIYH